MVPSKGSWDLSGRVGYTSRPVRPMERKGSFPVTTVGDGAGDGDGVASVVVPTRGSGVAGEGRDTHPT